MRHHHYHFIGIGGSGMSAIAKVLLERGAKVSGSDLAASHVTRRLERLGASIAIGHREENVDGADAVIVSSAIPESNPELQAARRQDIPVYTRGEMLARLMDERRGIGIAGSHGKTTTTSMIAMVMERAGLDPTVLVGGELNDIGGNAKVGSGPYMVAETDESDGSFLMLRPHVAVVTNVEDDHLEYWNSVERLQHAFLEYLDGVREGGFAIVCADDPVARELGLRTATRVRFYGIDERAEVRARDVELQGIGSRFKVLAGDTPLGVITLKVPGVHNVQNALAALAVALELGISFEVARDALASFSGVRRRFQVLGQEAGITVVDDYAHHPTEIATTLAAARRATEGRLICVFQPHRFTRTRDLHESFGPAFKQADEVVVTEIYPAGEAPIPGVTSELISRSIERSTGRTPHALTRPEDIMIFLKNTARPGDLVLTLGAGDIWKVGEIFVRSLREEGTAEAGGRADGVVTTSG